MELSATTGFGLDLSINADNARVINRAVLRADVTGPIRLNSAGTGGLISGDVRVDRARFRLGRPSAAAVPRPEVREINRMDGGDDDAAPTTPRRLDLKAQGH